MMEKSPVQGVGLVLSGGGAKGAYQVGVLKALNRQGIQVDAVAGASIGALNGAIVAAAKDQTEAAEHLEELWLELAEISPISLGSKALKIPAYLVALAGFGLEMRGTAFLSSGLAAVASRILGRNVRMLEGLFSSNEGLLCNQRIHQLIARYLPESGLSERVPLYASVYPTEGLTQDFLKILGSTFSLTDTANSEFIHVQKLPAQDQRKVLLASAALPLLFTPQEINGKLYTDGGQGGWGSAQGNTPIQPLLDAGYQNIVVTHLSDGSLWNRHCFPNASIIEIRPKTAAIERKGAVRDLLGFDNSSIPSWIEQGYQDAIACIGSIKKTLDAHSGLEASEKSMGQSLAKTGQAALRDAVRRLG